MFAKARDKSLPVSRSVNSARRMFSSEPALFRPLTHHHESEVPVAYREESLLEPRDPANVLLDGQSSHIPNGEHPSLAVTELWAEVCGVDAVRHQEARLAGGRLQHLDHLLIGGEQDSRYLVKARRGAETPSFNQVEQRDATKPWQARKCRRDATPGVLMQIGLPGSS